MTTSQAQRRLLEALGELRSTPGRDIGQQTDPLAAFLVGLQEAIRFSDSMGEPAITTVYRALADLASAVGEDLSP